MSACRASLSANTTAIGKVLRVKGCDVPVNAFLGIPYAQPPVGDLRFCPPQPQELWNGERECREFGAMCMQPVSVAKEAHEMLHYRYPGTTSEDCLFLNVYTPNLKRNAHLPVMVWFFGGGFGAGASDLFDGTALAGFHDVIIVTVNYRVGLFGFLTTGDDVIPGNNGLLDQVESLKWVQKHITSFGGDPDKVTIFGESSGGMSCSLHVMSEMTTGLFHRAIMQSGVATSPFAVISQQRARATLQPVLDEMGYKGSTSEDLAAFLRSRPAQELFDFKDPMMLFRLSKPVIDGHYLTDYPHNLYKEGKFQKVEIMAGCCSHEGYTDVKYSFEDPDLFNNEEGMRKQVSMSTIEPNYSENEDAILDAVYKTYITAEAVGNADVFQRQFCDLYSHLLFVAPNDFVIQRHSAKAPVYAYEYAYVSSFLTDQPSWVGGSHADDLMAVFDFGLTGGLKDVTASEADLKFSKIVMAYWTNFAKSGDPNGSGLTKWSPYDVKTKSYLILKEKPNEARDYQPEKMKFWHNEMPKLDTGRIYK